MLANYFKTAWRVLFRNKVYSIINIGGLGVSMSFVLLILLWVQNELRFDSYHHAAEQIYLVSEYNEETGELSELSPYPAYPAVQKEIPHIREAAVASSGYAYRPVFTIGTNRFYEQNVLYVDSNWAQLFDYEVLEGNFNIFKYAGHQIAISQSKAQQFFGNTPAVGQSLLIDTIPATIGAVFADVPSNSSFRQDILIPNQVLFANDYYRHVPDEWDEKSQLIFVKLDAADHADQSSKLITSLFRSNQSTEQPSFSHRLVPLTGLHFNEAFAYTELPRGNKHTLGIFSILAFLLLLTASINFINLSVARISIRHKEIGMRKLAGADKRALFIQVMAETALATLLSCVLAAIMAAVLLPHFNTYFETQLTFSLLHTQTVLLIISAFFAVWILTGIYPALLIGGINPLHLFRGRAMFGTSNRGVRDALLVGQLILAVGMTIGVIVIRSQFRYIQHQAAGYQMDQVFKLYAPLPDNMIHGFDQQAIANHRQLLQRVKSDLLAHSAIKHVAKVNGVSLIDNSRSHPLDYEWSGYPPSVEPQSAVSLSVDPDYLSIADIEIRDGRWFDPANGSDQYNIIINETAIKAFGLKEPVVGTAVSNPFTGQEGTVIGVVNDFHHASLHQPIEPLVIELDQHGMGLVFLVQAEANRVQEAIEVAGNIWKQHYPNKPFEYTFLDEEFDQLYKTDRKAFTFSMVFATLSLLISCLGMLSMVLLNTEQRTKEIGIRKVLGASVTGIVALLSKDFVKLVCLAIVIASPIAWWAMTKWLDDFAYRIDIQWWMFTLAGTAAVAIALLTVSWQAVRAAVANPVDSLRDE